MPGAFSSNKGEDFRTVLEELCKIKDINMSMPRPCKRKNAGLEWRNAGSIMGNGYSLAWRVLNAQFWGVPQRRKRIFLVADFTGERAGKILFERQGLSRYFTQSENEGQGVTTVTENGIVGASGNAIAYSFDSLPSNSMKSKNPHSGCNVVEIAKCLDTTYPCPSKNQGGIAIVQPLSAVIYDARGNGTGDICPTITGDHNGHISDYTAICIAGNTIDREPQNGGNGVGSQEDISYTLNTVDKHAVAYSLDRASFNQGENAKYDFSVQEELAQTLVANGSSAVAYDCQNFKESEEISGTLQAKENGGYSLNYIKKYKYIIRRLTPLECCRLQGFPDWWCSDIPHSDSAEYKMWGNGVALPC
ncbi:MAG: DNA cytosine methyltransferase, partial [Oscillospiraceae bacterium]